MTAQPAGTGLVWDEIYLAHEVTFDHPERPERLLEIRRRLEQSGLWERLVHIPVRAADKETIALVHSPQYIDRVEESCRRGVGYLDSLDTPIGPRSYEAAIYAVGGLLAAVDAVIARQVNNAFCAVRPPGHHACYESAMGFCLFNNVAVAARYVQQKHGLERVLVIDFDVHHGNGTQDAFYDDPSVFYFSTHRWPFYPGTGSEREVGSGKGQGYTLNVPLPAGSGDAVYIRAFQERLLPAAEEFRPQFVLVSAGFDAHKNDPLGGMEMTASGYAAISEIICQIAQEHAEGRLVSVLEGGYDLEGLAESVQAHVEQLLLSGD